MFEERSNSAIAAFIIIIIIIAVFQVIAYYSIGRSHGGKVEITFPTMKEWLYLAIIALITKWADAFFIDLFSSKYKLKITKPMYNISDDLTN